MEPADIPVNTPLVGSIVPKVLVLVLQAPPVAVLCRVVAPPGQTNVVPVMFGGVGFTVSTL